MSLVKVTDEYRKSTIEALKSKIARTKIKMDEIDVYPLQRYWFFWKKKKYNHANGGGWLAYSRDMDEYKRLIDLLEAQGDVYLDDDDVKALRWI